MYLKFIINYISNNTLVEKIVKKVAKQTNTNIGITKDNENIYIFMELNEEKINIFSNALDKALPASIFLKKLDAIVVDEFENSEIELENISMPPCPECTIKHYKITILLKVVKFVDINII